MESVLRTNRYTLNRLRRHWILVFSVAVLALASGYLLLRNWWAPAHALSWLVFASLVIARELWLLWKGLPDNRRNGEEALLTTLGYGNMVTLGRGLAVACLAGFLFSPRPPGWLAWAPAVAYLCVAMFDHLDGYIARLTHHTTKLGESLDMEFDVMGILAAVILGITYGQLPIWYLLVGLARELFLLGIWLRKRAGKAVYDLPPSMDRRLIAGLQMGFLGVVLWPIFSPPATTLAAVLFAIPMAISFGRDWMVVSGAWQTDSPEYIRRRHRAKRLLEYWLPVFVRPLGLLSALIIFRREIPVFTGWYPTLAALSLEEPALWLWGLASLFGLATLLFVLGAVGRLAAVALIAMACLDILSVGFAGFSNGLLLTCGIVVLQMGSGAYSLWQPEEHLLRLRAGESEEESG